MKKNKSWTNLFMQFNDEMQRKILSDFAREIIVWLKAKGLYEQALKDTTTLQYFDINNHIKK